jgi:hypothetical protein
MSCAFTLVNEEDDSMESEETRSDSVILFRLPSAAAPVEVKAMVEGGECTSKECSLVTESSITDQYIIT